MAQRIVENILENLYPIEFPDLVNVQFIAPLMTVAVFNLICECYKKKSKVKCNNN